MGFFSDLKDDLSQAVNELMPEEQVEEKETEEASADFDSDLSDMLDNVEAMEIPVEESIYVAPAAEEKVMDFGNTSRRVSDEVSVFTESMIINGNIATEGGLDIRGSIVGNVEALGKLNITGAIQGNSQAAEIYADGAKITGELRSQGTIKVGQSTVIIGNIYATSAVIAGAVKGEIDVKGPVVIDSTAIIKGNVKAKSVQMNNGAVLEGFCSLAYASVEIDNIFE